MAIHDTESLLVETGPADLTPTLPDPTTVSGRTHDLSSNGAAAAVWGSTGATPFQTDGVNTTTLTVPRGSRARVQSDGTHWVLIRPGGSRPSFAGSAVSDASGNAVFTFPAGLFPAAPDVALGIQAAASSNPIDYRITALTATSCTVNVRQSATLVILSLSVLGIAAPLAGVTVHAVATSAGTST